MSKVVTKLDGQDYEETQTLEQLAAWSSSRWQAGQHEAALNVQKRFEALARVKHKGKKYEIVRDDETGELVLILEEEKKVETTPPAGGQGNG